MSTTSRPAGLRMPAEWAPHERTLIAWPAREEAWRGGATIEDARDAHAEVVAAVAAFEPVTLVADPAHAEDARRRVPHDSVEVVSLPIDDSWLRDSGPIVVTDGIARAGIDFRFNAWGEAFTPYDKDAAIAQRVLEHLEIERFGSPIVLEGGSIAVDGEGTLLSTEQCLLNPNRNPLLDRAEIEQELRLQLGVERIVWLGQGLVEDADTDGHVDNVAAFVGPGRVLLQTVAEQDDPNWANARENRRRLQEAGLDVIDLTLLPRTKHADDGDTVAVPYMNFYLCNGAAIVPVAQLDHDMDEEALTRLRALLPGREVVGVPGRVLALGGGGVHCITQQIPKASA
ncbi:agmatine deiminase family protein [Conexibacter sp. JD483]|uniref:agmatine deiminase family protein n=1 Tax=unclassified Conexibacter TaxID=2627773 RepID=UPI0027224495|nr:MULTISPECIES: agmatine deiminase family protein [unclassified Conexibacter]MDO8185633.1 agmatine deiminase family protein [Conexibacter sp. CPCC 205706]MDO8198806.1 agmatine deiminase family protein [Conexibacter sp. CPCC 205762]MDR9367844.1 agmatine deiminase family protein [Conexibacter sp. JD483]